MTTISTLRRVSTSRLLSSQFYITPQNKTSLDNNQINHTEAYQIKATSSQHQLRNPPSLPFKLRTSHMPLLRCHLKIKIFWNDIFVVGGSCKIIGIWDIQIHTQNLIWYGYFPIDIRQDKGISKVVFDHTHIENGNTWSLLIKIFNKSTSDRIQEISEVVFNFAHKGRRHVFLSRWRLFITFIWKILQIRTLQWR